MPNIDPKKVPHDKLNDSNDKNKFINANLFLSFAKLIFAIFCALSISFTNLLISLYTSSIFKL